MASNTSTLLFHTATVLQDGRTVRLDFNLAPGATMPSAHGVPDYRPGALAGAALTLSTGMPLEFVGSWVDTGDMPCAFDDAGTFETGQGTLPGPSAQWTNNQVYYGAYAYTTTPGTAGNPASYATAQSGEFMWSRIGNDAAPSNAAGWVPDIYRFGTSYTPGASPASLATSNRPGIGVNFYFGTSPSALSLYAVCANIPYSPDFNFYSTDGYSTVQTLVYNGSNLTSGSGNGAWPNAYAWNPQTSQLRWTAVYRTANETDRIYFNQSVTIAGSAGLLADDHGNATAAFSGITIAPPGTANASQPIDSTGCVLWGCNLSYVDATSNGFLTSAIVPPATSTAYVSALNGNDGTAVLGSMSQPFATISKAVEAVYSNKFNTTYGKYAFQSPGWGAILLRRGETFDAAADVDLVLTAYGASYQEPCVFGSYWDNSGSDPGTRPVVVTNASLALTGVYVSIAGSNIVVEGIEFHRADLAFPYYWPSSTMLDVSVVSPGTNVIFSDCLLDRAYSSSDIGCNHLTFHRTIIRDTYIPTQGHCQGLYASQMQGLFLCETHIDNCGHKSPDRICGDIFSHGAYIQYTNYPAIVVACAFTRNGSHGVQLRPGGVIAYSYMAANGLASFIGSVGGTYYRPVVENGVDITTPPSAWSGTALGLTVAMNSGSPGTISCAGGFTAAGFQPGDEIDVNPGVGVAFQVASVTDTVLTLSDPIPFAMLGLTATPPIAVTSAQRAAAPASSATGTFTTGSPTVTGVTSLTGIAAGTWIRAVGDLAGQLVASASGTTITLASNWMGSAGTLAFVHMSPATNWVPIHSTGVTFTEGATTVTGTGCNFLDLVVGGAIKPMVDPGGYQIASIQSATQLTLAAPYFNPTVTATACDYGTYSLTARGYGLGAANDPVQQVRSLFEGCILLPSRNATFPVGLQITMTGATWYYADLIIRNNFGFYDGQVVQYQGTSSNTLPTGINTHHNVWIQASGVAGVNPYIAYFDSGWSDGAGRASDYNVYITPLSIFGEPVSPWSNNLTFAQFQAASGEGAHSIQRPSLQLPNIGVSTGHFYASKGGTFNETDWLNACRNRGWGQWSDVYDLPSLWKTYAQALAAVALPAPGIGLFDYYGPQDQRAAAASFLQSGASVFTFGQLS